MYIYIYIYIYIYGFVYIRSGYVLLFQDERRLIKLLGSLSLSDYYLMFFVCIDVFFLRLEN